MSTHNIGFYDELMKSILQLLNIIKYIPYVLLKDYGSILPDFAPN